VHDALIGERALLEAEETAVGFERIVGGFDNVQQGNLGQGFGNAVSALLALGTGEQALVLQKLQLLSQIPKGDLQFLKQIGR
jgi:hypothetical protein